MLNNSNDFEIIDKMKNIDWHSISKKDAKSFAFGLNLMTDAVNDVKNQTNVSHHARTMLISSLLVVSIGMILGSTSVGLLVGVMSILFMIYLSTLIGTRNSKKIMNIHRKDLISDIDNLTNLFPKNTPNKES